MMRTIVISAVLPLVAASTCTAQPTLDGSSEDAMSASIETVRASLPTDSLRTAFDTAVVIVAMQDVDLGALFGQALVGVTPDPDRFAREARDRLAGLTGAQVLSLADSITAERAAEQRRQAEAEIEELLQQKADAEAARTQLSRFVVERSRLRVQEGFIRPEIAIDLTVRNGLEAAVSRAYFRGTYQTPGRSVPWVQDSFNYEIPGGIEPGESASWALQPNMFGAWAKAADAPRDAVLTVEVYRLDGADGEALFGGATWDEDDEERLRALQEAIARGGV